LEDLEAAAAQVGMTLRYGQTSFRWYGRFMNDSTEGRELSRQLPVSEWGKCLHALTVNGHEQDAYEIGVVAALDGGEGYDLVFDSWGPGRAIVERCGASLEKLAENVGAEVAMRQMARKGYRVAREITTDGHVQVVCTKAGA
jgi:hypothetical protein